MNFIILYIFLEIILNESESFKLANVAASVANTKFEMRIPTCVGCWNDNNDEITDFLKLYNGNVIITNINGPEQNQTIKCEQIVFFVTTSDEFVVLLDMIDQYVITGIRVVLVLLKPHVEESEITEFTKTALNYDITEILILSNDVKDNVTLSTYFPNWNGYCDSYTPIRLEVGTKDYFPRKYQNFYGCPVKLSLLLYIPYISLDTENDTVTSFGGIDGKLVKLLIKGLNASIVAKSNRDGVGLFINDSWTGIFGDLVYHKSDIFAPGIMVTPERYRITQMSYTYRMYSIIWCGPKRREIHAWAKVFFPLLTGIMLALCLSFVGFLTVALLIKRYGRHNSERERSILFYTLGTFLGQQIQFETKYWLMSALLILWLWFCLIVRIAYQGELIKSLQKKLLEPPMETLNEAIKEVDGYGAVESITEFYKGTPIEKNFQALPLSKISEYIKDIGNGKRFLLATNIAVIRHFRQQVQILEETVNRTPVCLFMRPRWSAIKEINRILTQLMETGFIEKIEEDYRYEWLNMGKNNTNEQKAISLDLYTLSACFYSLIIQWFICFIVLYIEILIHKFKNRQT